MVKKNKNHAMHAAKTPANAMEPIPIVQNY